MAANTRFGWRSGTLRCRDAKILGDIYVQDDIIFSDVSAGTLGVTGGIDMTETTSAVGIDTAGGVFSTGAIRIGDDTNLVFGADNDVTFEYDEDGTNNLRYDGADMVFDVATKLLFRDSALSINSSADGQLDILADTKLQLTSPTIDLEASTGIALDGDTVIDGAHIFTTGTGAVSLNGSVGLATTKTYTSGTGSAIGGIHIIYQDGAGAKSFEVIPGTSVSINETNINLTGRLGVTGALTVSDDLTVNGGETYIIKTDDGVTGGELYLSQVSASPAALDSVGVIYGRGRNSIDGDVNYGTASFGIVSPTSTVEIAGYTISLLNGNGAAPTTPQFTINGGSGAVGIVRESNAAEGAALTLTQVSASAAANDQIGYIKFLGNNDQTPVDLVEYTQIYSIITDVTADAEWGQGRFKAINGTGSLGVAGGWSHDGSYGNMIAGDGSGQGVFRSLGDNDIVLQTGNATTGSITITDGPDGDIDLSPNGTGEVLINGAPIESNLKVATVTLSSSQVKNCAGTPITLVAAQGANTVIKVMSVGYKLDYAGTNVFTEAAQMVNIFYTNNAGQAASMGFSGAGWINQNADYYRWDTPPGMMMVPVTSATVENLPIVFSHSGGEWAGNAANDNTVQVIMTYYVEDYN